MRIIDQTWILIGIFMSNKTGFYNNRVLQNHFKYHLSLFLRS